MDKFTFYGDLLGIASAYRLGAQAAHQKLNSFYNIVFDRLAPLCGDPNRRIHVQMFSDSLILWGDGTKQILGDLEEVYLDLLDKNLLLRGAIVDGALDKEPRVEVEHFRKFLPTNDTLARAVGLEKTVKGARLLIEPALAGRLLVDYPAWLTVEGYLDNTNIEVPQSDILRRICPTPSGSPHEPLYFWKCTSSILPSGNEPKLGVRLKELTEFHDPYVSERKLPRYAHTSIVDSSGGLDRGRNWAGGIPPSESCGRFSL